MSKLLRDLSHYKLSKYNYQIFMLQLEDYFTNNSITDQDVKKAILISCLVNCNIELLNELNIIEIEKKASYNDLIQLLDSHFIATDSSRLLQAYLKFFNTFKREKQSIPEWMNEVVHLANNCGFGSEHSYVANMCFITGLDDAIIKEKLYKENIEEMSPDEVVSVTLQNEACSGAEKDAQYHKTNFSMGSYTIPNQENNSNSSFVGSSYLLEEESLVAKYRKSHDHYIADHISDFKDNKTQKSENFISHLYNFDEHCMADLIELIPDESNGGHFSKSSINFNKFGLPDTYGTISSKENTNTDSVTSGKFNSNPKLGTLNKNQASEKLNVKIYDNPIELLQAKLAKKKSLRSQKNSFNDSSQYEICDNKQAVAAKSESANNFNKSLINAPDEETECTSSNMSIKLSEYCLHKISNNVIHTLNENPSLKSVGVYSNSTLPEESQAVSHSEIQSKLRETTNTSEEFCSPKAIKASDLVHRRLLKTVGISRKHCLSTKLEGIKTEPVEASHDSDHSKTDTMKQIKNNFQSNINCKLETLNQNQVSEKLPIKIYDNPIQLLQAKLAKKKPSQSSDSCHEAGLPETDKYKVHEALKTESSEQPNGSNDNCSFETPTKATDDQMNCLSPNISVKLSDYRLHQISSSELQKLNGNSSSVSTDVCSDDTSFDESQTVSHSGFKTVFTNSVNTPKEVCSPEAIKASDIVHRRLLKTIANAQKHCLSTKLKGIKKEPPEALRDSNQSITNTRKQTDNKFLEVIDKIGDSSSCEIVVGECGKYAETENFDSHDVSKMCCMLEATTMQVGESMENESLKLSNENCPSNNGEVILDGQTSNESSKSSSNPNIHCVPESSQASAIVKAHQESKYILNDTDEDSPLETADKILKLNSDTSICTNNTACGNSDQLEKLSVRDGEDKVCLDFKMNNCESEYGNL